MYRKNSDRSETYFIPNSVVSFYLLDKIIAIKSASWWYTYNEHRDWISKNITNRDLHVVVVIRNCLVAYCNLKAITMTKNSTQFQAIGLGNVCSNPKGFGHGKKLMKNVNSYLNERGMAGVLFCKKELIEFYKTNGWELINDRKIYTANSMNDSFAMSYNAKFDFGDFEILEGPF